MQGGLEETQHVFIQGNDLTSRFQQAQHFVIAETGFGSGLNFIATVEHWQRHAPPESTLHYIAVERHPFTPSDLAKALSAWPRLQTITEQLLAAYPDPCHGFHSRELLAGRVKLLLLWGDAESLLPECTAQVNAWYLDGFAPSKNNSLWTTQLFQTIAELTAPGGTFATYTSAGGVRRGLQAAGFEVVKRQGFGKKREMLSGTLVSVPRQVITSPWFHHSPGPISGQQHAIVVGAGMAGVTSAVALAKRGWRITLVEQQAHIANAASGNPVGVIMPRLTADMSLEARFYLSAFLYTVTWLRQAQRAEDDNTWHPKGVIQLLSPEKQRAIAGIGLPESLVRSMKSRAITEVLGVVVEQGGVLYPQAGWLEPRQLCEQLLQKHDGIELKTSSHIERLNFADAEWQLWGQDGVLATAPVVIIATGHQAEQLLPDPPLGIQAVRGQLTYVTSASSQLRQPLCYDGYVIPMSTGEYCVGATYDRESHDAQLCEADQQANLDALQHAVEAFQCDRIYGGRVAFRASSRDHLPLVGPVPDSNYYRQQYANLHHGRPVTQYPLANYAPGLYVNSGHGSRGLTSCPLTAEIIACMINHEPLPIPEEMRLALHPARELVRRLRRHRG